MAVITRKYTIKRLDRELHTYIRSLPEFVYMQGSNTFVLDHVDTTTELQFQAELAKRVSGLDIDTVNTNIGRFIDEIKTDQLFFTTETAVTKTNVGTAYVDIFTDFGGRPFFIDTTGFTRLAVQVL